MKYLKILLLLISFSSILQGEIIRNIFFDSNEDICINDNYFIYEDNYYAQASSTNQWYSGLAVDGTSFIKSGYLYDTDTNECTLETLDIIGLDESQFNFLMALSGIIFSSIIFYILASFLVGL